jgi:hypothetical protein
VTVHDCKTIAEKRKKIEDSVHEVLERVSKASIELHESADEAGTAIRSGSDEATAEADGL